MGIGKIQDVANAMLARGKHTSCLFYKDVNIIL